MKLEDDSPMPCGKHQGEPMQSVPAEYLDWLLGQGWLKHSRNPDWQAVREYIEENIDVIQSELES